MTSDEKKIIERSSEPSMIGYIAAASIIMAMAFLFAALYLAVASK